MKLLGKKMGYTVLKKKLKTRSIMIIDIGNDFYFVKFHTDADYEFALTGCHGLSLIIIWQ